MSGKKPDLAQKLRLLEKLRPICREGVAENEPDDRRQFAQDFLPIQAHFRVLDPDVRIIIGDRGTGKTHLFRALKDEDGLRALIQLAHDRHLPSPGYHKTSWLVGYDTEGKEFPPPTLIMRFAEEQRSPVALQSFWVALLAKVLFRKEMIPPSAFPHTLTTAFTSVECKRLCQEAEKSGEALFWALDALDDRLEDEDRFVFASYDGLDRISPGNWEAMETILQGLVQFWAAYTRRWKRIRPKIFLRRDLYDAAMFGPDIAKVAANRAELLWAIPEFYGCLFKRLLNDNGFFGYLSSNRKGKHGQKQLAIAHPLPFREDGYFGRIPNARREDQYKEAVDLMFGQFMGKSAKKGMTLKWIPKHLQDGQGRIYPRSFLRLTEHAADIEMRDRKAEGTQYLIHHTALRGALDRVSEDRVGELAHEEFRWISDVREAFRGRDLLIPSSRSRLISVLRTITWSNADDRPRSTRPSSLIDYLVDLGVFSNRPDGRVDVGDLYLSGFYLRRKGGVEKPRALTSFH